MYLFGQNYDNKTRWKPKREDIDKILQLHKTWLDTGGKEGNRAEFFHADLSGADLHGANLRRAHFDDTFFYKANLRNANLTETKGIKPEFLAGADLSGAGLPDDLKWPNIPAKYKKISSFARWIFIILLILLHYSWLTLSDLGDADLLSRVKLLPYIMPSLQIPATQFFGLLPLMLFILYAGLHFCLQLSWKKSAELPAFLPDSTRPDQQLYYWFANRLIGLSHKSAGSISGFANGLLDIATGFTLRWLAPCTIIWFWFRYLTRHDWDLSFYHALLSGMSIFLALLFRSLTRQTVRREKLTTVRIFPRIIYAVLAVGLFFGVTFAVIKSVPSRIERSPLNLASEISHFFGYNLFADFSNGEISKKHGNQSGENLQISEVIGADLKGLDAPYSTGRLAFLVKADLSSANLKWAILDSANLREAVLSRADLSSASLIGANLQGADLSGATLEKADLFGTNLRDVKGLSIQVLHSANNWLYALYGGAILDSLNLPSDHNENIIAKNLSGYNLSSVDFRGAALSGFNLTGANFQKADLTGADIVDANIFLTDLRGAVGLEKEKLQTARNWFFAIYDEEWLNNLGLPINHNEQVGNKDFQMRNFDGFNLDGADFRGANLRQAQMGRVNLKGASLEDADLYAVNLSNANLTGTDFKGTILLDTDISGADLTGAVNLTMEQVRWAKYDSTTIFPEYLKDSTARRLQSNIVIDTIPKVEPLDSFDLENKSYRLE